MVRRILFSIMLVFACLFVLKPINSIAAEDQGNDSGAETAHFQFSILSPIQLVDAQKNISGLRLTLLYGENADVSGVDLGLGINYYKNLTGIQIAGLINHDGDAGHPHFTGNTVKGIQIAGLMNMSDAAVSGIQLAGLGSTADSLSGLQISILANGVTNDATGIQVGLLGNNVGGEMKGVQVGFFNNSFAYGGVHLSNSVSVTGIQIGVFDYAANMTGVQFGAFNYAANMTGIQIGIYNECENLKGVQIGLLNHIEHGTFPYLPIINAQF